MTRARSSREWRAWRTSSSVEIKDRVAAGALVACVDEGVEGERIVLGRGDLFFDEGTENAELNAVEMHKLQGCHS